MIYDSDLSEPSPLTPASILDAAYNLNVSILINRAHLAIQTEQWETAQTLLSDAIDITPKLQLPTVPEARCWFWHGVVADKTHQEEYAPAIFVAALPCRYHSREGENLIPYIKKYKQQIIETLEDSRRKPDEREHWMKVLEDTEGKKRTFYSEECTESPISYLDKQKRSALCSQRDFSDSKDEEEVLRHLIRDSDDPGSYISQHEIRAVVKTRPKAAPSSMSSHSLPENVLMKPLSMGSRQAESKLTLVDRSATVRGRSRSLPLSKQTLKDHTRRQFTSPPKSVEEASSMRIMESLNSTYLMRSLSKRILPPIETQKHEQSSEPGTPSPLRTASLPGDDMSLEKDLEEAY